MFHGYPHLYYQRGSTSDKKFVLSRMAVIPQDLKEQVSREYMAFQPVLGGEHRRKANEWLHELASKYRNTPNVRQEVERKIEAMPPKSHQIEPKPKDDTNAPVKRESFLESLFDEVDRKHRNKVNN